jgi:hypothetical protein
MERRGDRTAPVSITSARVARSDDIRGREVRYVLSMLVRTVCLIGAVFADGIFRWVLVAGALFLPYIAVVLANAGVQKDPSAPDSLTPGPAPELGQGRDPRPL